MKYYTVEGKKKSIFRVFAIYYICMALFCMVRISASISGFYPEGQLGDFLFTVLVQVGILFILPLLLYCVLIKINLKQAFEHCNFFRVNYRVVLISIALGILCFVINIAVSSLFNGILVFSGYEFSGSGGEADYSIGNFILQLFLVAFLPAICEEFIHRGILLQGIKHIGFKKAILISSTLFALIHFNIQQVSYAFVVGLILGFVAVVAKNIWPAVIIHFVNNAISTYLNFATARGWIMGDLLEDLSKFLTSNNSAMIFIVVSLVMIAVMVLLCLLVWLLYKQSIIRNVNKAINKAYNNFSISSRNKPIRITDEHEVIMDLLESNTLLNLDYKSIQNPIEAVMPKEKSRYKPKPMDRLFLWGAVVLGAVITIFTYAWGLF